MGKSSKKKKTLKSDKGKHKKHDKKKEKKKSSKSKIPKDSSKSEIIKLGFCPCCKKHCPLSHPKCKKGKKIAEKYDAF